MSQTNQQAIIGLEKNFFSVSGIVRFQPKYFITKTNKKPYLVFSVQQPQVSYKTKKPYFSSYQIITFKEELVTDFVTRTKQFEVEITGNVSIENYTKDNKPISVVKLIGNGFKIVKETEDPFIVPKWEAIETDQKTPNKLDGDMKLVESKLSNLK